MKQYASWVALALAGIVLVITGLEGRTGLVIATIFTPASLLIRGEDPIPGETSATPEDATKAST